MFAGAAAIGGAGTAAVGQMERGQMQWGQVQHGQVQLQRGQRVWNSPRVQLPPEKVECYSFSM